MQSYIIMASLSFFATTAMAFTKCHTSEIARAAVEADAHNAHPGARVSLVGESFGSNLQATYTITIWANYRSRGYSDKYDAIVDKENCRLISLDLKEKNQPMKEGDSIIETEEVSIETKVNSDTLFSTNSSLAVLRLPHDERLDTAITLSYADYLAGASDETSAQQLMSQSIEQAGQAGGYLNLNYSIHRKNKYQIINRGSMVPIPICSEVILRNRDH